MGAELRGEEPWNFSWLIPGVVAGSSWVATTPEMIFLKNSGVGHVVSLTTERRPPALDGVQRHLIPVEEFLPPTLEQIDHFISICEKAQQQHTGICVHCRQGNGRTGVMLACFLVKFRKQIPEVAISNVRFSRPYSVETYEQERIVRDYWDHLARLQSRKKKRNEKEK